LQGVTGTKASGRISIIGFFKGEIGFKNVLIYSPEKYYKGAKAIYVKKITLEPDWFSLFSSKKIIKNVDIDGIAINNIMDILGHSAKHYNSAKGSSQCEIQGLSLRNIVLNTFYKGGYPVSSRMPNVALESINGGSGLMNTIGAALTIGLNDGFKKDDGRSFWQKTGDVLGTGFNIGINILSIGSSAIETVASVTNQTSMAISSF